MGGGGVVLRESGAWVGVRSVTALMACGGGGGAIMAAAVIACDTSPAVLTSHTTGITGGLTTAWPDMNSSTVSGIESNALLADMPTGSMGGGGGGGGDGRGGLAR